MSTIEKVGQALTALGIDDFVIRADVLIDTEEKFNKSFRKIIGKENH